MQLVYFYLSLFTSTIVVPFFCFCYFKYQVYRSELFLISNNTGFLACLALRLLIQEAITSIFFLLHCIYVSVIYRVNKTCCCCYFNILYFFKLELKKYKCQFWTSSFSISLNIVENLIVKRYTDQTSTAEQN